MKLTCVGVDLAKQVFQVHGVDRAERPAWCKRLKRNRWIGISSETSIQVARTAWRPVVARTTGLGFCRARATGRS